MIAPPQPPFLLLLLPSYQHLENSLSLTQSIEVERIGIGSKLSCGMNVRGFFSPIIPKTTWERGNQGTESDRKTLVSVVSLLLSLSHSRSSLALWLSRILIVSGRIINRVEGGIPFAVDMDAYVNVELSQFSVDFDVENDAPDQVLGFWVLRMVFMSLANPFQAS